MGPTPASQIPGPATFQLPCYSHSEKGKIENVNYLHIPPQWYHWWYNLIIEDLETTASSKAWIWLNNSIPQNITGCFTHPYFRYRLLVQNQSTVVVRCYGPSWRRQHCCDVNHVTWNSVTWNIKGRGLMTSWTAVHWVNCASNDAHIVKNLKQFAVSELGNV